LKAKTGDFLRGDQMLIFKDLQQIEAALSAERD